MTDPHIIVRNWESLRSDADQWRTHWREALHYTCPTEDVENHTDTRVEKYFDLVDTTAIEAVDQWTNGVMSEIFPQSEEWFLWEDPARRGEPFQSHYNRSADIARIALQMSNFYAHLRPFIRDLATVGTAALHVRPGREVPFVFTYIRNGSYAIAESDEGQPNQLYREFHATPLQIQQMFPDHGSEFIRTRVQQQIQGRMSQEQRKIKVIHACYEQVPGATLGPDSHRYRSVYVLYNEKELLNESGTDYFPYGIVRTEKSGSHVYGLSPTMKAMPAIRDANELAKYLNEGVATRTRPRMMVPSRSAKTIDYRPGAITVFNPLYGNQQAPFSWGTDSDIVACQGALELHQRRIREMFGGRSLDSIPDATKVMTAREIAAIETLELRHLLPLNNQIIAEFSTMMRAIYHIGASARLFPPSPDGSRVPPRASFLSRIGLISKQLQNASVDRVMERALAIAQADPTVLDNFDMDYVIRLSARNDGAPEDILEDTMERDRTRQQRAEQQQAQAELQAAESLSQSAANLAKSNIPLPIATAS